MKSSLEMTLRGLLILVLLLGLDQARVMGAAPESAPEPAAREQYLERAQELLRAATQEGNIPLQIRALLAAAKEHQALGQTEDALSCYQQALGLARDLGDGGIQGAVLYSRGIMLQQAGRMDLALDSYQEAAALGERTRNYFPALVSRNNAAKILIGQGRYREAVEETSSAVRLSRHLASSLENDNERRAVAETLCNAGIAHYYLGDYLKALDNLRRGELLFENSGTAADRVRTKLHLGAVLNNLGRFRQSAAEYRQAATLAASIPYPKGEADALTGVGNALQYEGAQEPALEAYGKAAEIYQKTGDAESAARVVGNMGAVWLDLLEYDKAEAHLEDALARFHALRDARGMGFTLGSLGYLNLLLDRTDKAQKCFDGAVKTLSECVCKKELAIVYAHMGKLKLRQGQYEPAASDFRKALALLAGSGRGETIWRAHAGLGGALAATGDRQSSLDHYLMAVEVIEQIRWDLVEPDLRNQYLFDKLDVYNELIRALIEANSKYGAFENLRRRNRWLSRNSLGRRLQMQGLPDGTGEQVDKGLSARIHMEDGADRDAGRAPGTKVVPETTRSDVDWPKESRFDCDRLLESLAPDSAVIAYFLDDDRVFVFTLTRDMGLKLSRLPVSAKDLRGNAAIFRSTLSSAPLHGDGPGKRFEDASVFLYDRLIEPLDETVQGKPRWYIVPDEELWTIPFSALGKPEGDGMHFLLEDHTLCLSNSLGELSSGNAEHEKKDGPHVVAFGNPDGLLPGAQREIQRASSLDDKARVFSGRDASEQNARTFSTQADILVFATHAEHPRAARDAYLALAATADDDGRLTTDEIREMKLGNLKLVLLSGCSTAVSHDEGSTFLSLADSFVLAGADAVVGTLWEVNDRGAQYLVDRFLLHLKRTMNCADALRKAQLDCLNASALERAPGSAETSRSTFAHVSDSEALPATEVALEISSPYYWAPFVMIEGSPFGDRETRR